jgi:hypothetical protein
MKDPMRTGDRLGRPVVDAVAIASSILFLMLALPASADDADAPRGWFGKLTVSGLANDEEFLGRIELWQPVWQDASQILFGSVHFGAHTGGRKRAKDADVAEAILTRDGRLALLVGREYGMYGGDGEIG